MDTDIFVVRHGETNANLQAIIQGQTDIPLNETGHKQAQCIANRMNNEHLDAVFSSDLSRAYITAKMIAEPHGLTPVKLQALREWDLGDLCGMPLADIREQYPDIIKAFSVIPAGDVPVPGGESRYEFSQRISDCMDILAERFQGKRILLVTHGGVLRCMYDHVNGSIPGKKIPKTSNVGLSWFCKHDDGWQMVCWNDASHLIGQNLHESKIF